MRRLVENAGRFFMRCQEVIYSENALDFIVGNYGGETYIRDFYDPDCYIPLDSLQAVIYKEEASVGSEAIERYGYSAIPNVYGLMSEEALEASGVLRIRRQPYLDLYGRGVLVGLVDTGIDYTHEAFRNADNTSRILSIWDQTVQEGEGTGRFTYGREYGREELNRALADLDPLSIVPEQDESGHGTFLAGVAAGNENRSEGFSGVAPLSELVVVKCKQSKNIYREYYGIPADVPAYQENDIMLGIIYLLTVASAVGRPIVICIGVGTNMGNHSGNSNLSVLMDRYMTYQGVSIFTCIGNEGNARHHHRITQKDDTVSINVERSMNGFMAQLWWRTPGRLTLDMISPSGEQISGIRTVSGGRLLQHFSRENTEVEIFFGVSQGQTREQVVVFRFMKPKTGIWKIQTHFDYQNPDFHMWLPIKQFLQYEVVFLEPDPDFTICNPGTGPDMMTISAYDSSNGSLFLQAGRGFSTNGDVKPEVVAPGVELTGPYPRGRYGSMTGTGVAAALATGIGALFMEQNGEEGVTGIAMKELFIQGAIPRGTPYPNTEWGFGIVDAYASLTNY